MYMSHYNSSCTSFIQLKLTMNRLSDIMVMKVFINTVWMIISGIWTLFDETELDKRVALQVLSMVPYLAAALYLKKKSLCD